LLSLCASYKYRHGEWPTEIRISPPFLRSLATTPGPEGLERLAERLEIHTLVTEPGPEWMTVSGVAGPMNMGHENIPPRELRPRPRAEVDSWFELRWEAARWLGVQPPAAVEDH
jgi:hypothetical protein